MVNKLYGWSLSNITPPPEVNISPEKVKEALQGLLGLKAQHAMLKAKQAEDDIWKMSLSDADSNNTGPTRQHKQKADSPASDDNEDTMKEMGRFDNISGVLQVFENVALLVLANCCTSTDFSRLKDCRHAHNSFLKHVRYLDTLWHD
jgi:hypothetical protein